jgi:hypothetical protein
VSAALAVAPVAQEEESAEAIELMPLLVMPREEEKPSSRLLAAGLPPLEAPPSASGRALLGNRLGTPVASASEELASVPTNASRRTRLLAQYSDRQLGPEPAPPAIVRERLARRLGDAENSERSSRFGRDIDSFGTPMPQIVALRF